MSAFLKQSCLIILSILTLSIMPIYVSAESLIKTNSYKSQLNEWKQKGTVNANNTKLEIKAGDFKKISGTSNIKIGVGLDNQQVLIWDDNTQDFELDVQVLKDGLYNIQIEYLPTGSANEPIQRGVMIDGKYPFEEARNFLLQQNFKDDEYPFLKDENGNHLRPKQQAANEWLISPIRDVLAFYEEPIKFYLSKGEHKIRLIGGSGAFKVSRVFISSPLEYLPYSDYVKNHSEIKDISNFLLEIEAEKVYRKSSQSIQVQNIAESGITPESYGTKIFNTIGGTRWRYPNDYIIWEFEVLEEGNYDLGIKYQQSFNTDIDVFRTIEIDGQTPFKEMLAVNFPYVTAWDIKKVGNDKGTFKLYLKKGRHTLTLRATATPYRDVIQSLGNISEKIHSLDLEVNSITGKMTNDKIDRYRIWNLNQYMPDITSRLDGLANELLEQAQKMSVITNKDKSTFDILMICAADLKKYAKDTELIPKKPDSLGLIQSQLMTWSENLKNQPLLVDKIFIKSKDREFPPASTGLINKVLYSVKNFFKSFSIDNNNVKGHNEDAVQVWVQRNRDLVNLMQEYADQYFTPQTGIEVNVNYMPGQNLLVMANVAGKQPDLASGVALNIPFEFSLRNALVNLNKLEGYEKIKSTVAPGTLIPYHYKNGDYGLPEEVTFSLMYYREDILKNLGLSPPETWEDVKKLLPTLQQKNYNFHYPYGDWLTFFYQNGVEVYKPNGMDIAFDNPKGYQTFKNYTDLYVKYGMPIRLASFYQHFRLGDIPIGISPCTDYVNFRLAAPDINGLWKIKPIPGTLQQDGSITRWNGGGAKGMMMFKTTQKRQEKAWEYMKWWLSTDIQAQFGNDLENYYGLEFRWYPANIEAVKRLPWSVDEKKVVLEQMMWLKEMPYVPGGSYITSREIHNAMTRTIIDKGNYRNELDKTIEEVRREIVRKQQEFGLTDSGGNFLETLDILQIPIPEKGDLN